jgi:hypothetical protein
MVRPNLHCPTVDVDAEELQGKESEQEKRGLREIS